MLPAMIPARIRAFLVLCVLIAGVLLPSRTTVAVSQQELVDAHQNWLHEQVGVWNCQGVSALTGAEEPYYGNIKTRWSADGKTLLLRFSEYRPYGAPFREEQRWDYDAATGTHSRALTTNDGSYGVLTSQGPDGNSMQWEGDFVTPQVTLDASETLIRISAETYEWRGTISLDGQELGYYTLTCNKRGH